MASQQNLMDSEVILAEWISIELVIIIIKGWDRERAAYY